MRKPGLLAITLQDTMKKLIERRESDERFVF